jgi:lipoyl(octanoyl) transferase
MAGTNPKGIADASKSNLDAPKDILDATARDGTIGWAVSSHPVDYAAAVSAMEARVARIALGNSPELIWLLEHPPIYTAGTSAREADLITPNRFPVHRTGRGGQYTYHGPGQRVVYVMLDLRKRGGDVRAFIQALEQWIIATLSAVGVAGVVRDGRIGVWVERPTQGYGAEDKIAALGIRVRRSISYHGLSINVAPALDHFDGIVPCGISEFGVTSLKDLEITADMPAVDRALQATFGGVFDEFLISEQAPL